MVDGSRRTIALEWVVYEGRDAHVTEFGDFPVGSRPDVTCPECGEELTLKLGKERAWHAAHKPAAVCAMSDGESALHHNTKMVLAKKLRTATALVVNEDCVGGEGGLVSEDCLGPRRRDWVSGWTSVVVERTVQTRRPDIALLDCERVVGAVEVWVSHRVEPDKQELYADWDVAWIEVAASEDLIDGDEAWAPPAALPVAQMGPGEAYRCEACVEYAERTRQRLVEEAAKRQALEEQRRRAQEEWEAKQAEREAARKAAEAEEKQERRAFQSGVYSILARVRANGVAFERILVFDRLESDGMSHRDALVLADVHQDGEKLGSFVGVASDRSVLGKVRAAAGRDGYLHLQRLADEHLSRMRAGGTVIDAPAGWFPLLSVLGDADFVSGWTWEGKDHRWPVDDAPVMQPWKVPWADSGVDCLDLLRFVLARYLSGLPVRYIWSKKTQGWFQPPVMREEAWRLWPGELGRVARVARSRRRRQ